MESSGLSKRALRVLAFRSLHEETDHDRSHYDCDHYQSECVDVPRVVTLKGEQSAAIPAITEGTRSQALVTWEVGRGVITAALDEKHHLSATEPGEDAFGCRLRGLIVVPWRRWSPP
jgi:hypothetical protein